MLDQSTPTESTATTEIPYGYCHCGCGQKTAIAVKSHTAKGWVAGEPRRFIRYHSKSRNGGAKAVPDDVRLAQILAKAVLNPENGCLEWKGRVTDKGYGVTCLHGKQIPAHRAVWTLMRGLAPRELHVCHQCDNRKCINIEHLFLGTPLDNMLDMVSKGRNVIVAMPGESNPFRKLNGDQVRLIREGFFAGMSQTMIGVQFGVAHSTIGRIMRGERWSHLGKDAV